MERANDKRLEELRNSGKKIYSISRLNTMDQCPYQAYMNYILGIKQKNIGIYGCLGGKCHDCIEECIKGTKTPDDIKIAINEELSDLEMFNIDFPLDRNGGTSIRDNWIANMTRFAEEFTVPNGKFITEELLILPIDDDHYMMGYADAIRFNNDGSVWLIDWKTSSNFDKNHLLSAGRQLIVYKLALEKLGYKVSKTSWCMLKYCETSWTLKNGKTKTKVSEWRNLVKDLKSVIEKFMEDAGYDEVDIEVAIHEAIQNNHLESLPDDISNKFKTKIYVRDYEITDDLIAETYDYIKNMINKFEILGDEELNYQPCDIDKNSYFCNALCGFGGKSGQCKYYVEYCEKFSESNNDEDDLF